MHCIKSQRQVWTWCSCYLSKRFTQSKLDSCFFLCATLGRLGFWQLFGPHWHERLESLSRWKPGWPSWHFTKQIRQEVLTIRNDIADPSCICLRQTTSCCKTHRRNQSRPERPQPQPPHRRGTFHRRLQPLYTETNTVSCSGFLPKA